MQGKNIVLYSRMLVFARGKGYLLYESLGCRPTKKKKDRKMSMRIALNWWLKKKFDMHRQRRDLEVQKKKGSIVRIKKVRKMCKLYQVMGILN